MPISGIFEYGIIAHSNTVELTKYFGSEKELEIPHKINGYTVTSIGSNVFLCCNSLRRAVIPDSVTKIGNCAFAGCNALESIVMPDSIKSIGYAAFDTCTSLTDMTIPNGVTVIGNFAFAGTMPRNIIFPNSVTNIGNGAFYDCASLISVTIPNSVTRIGDETFYGCSDLIIRCNPGSYAEQYAKEQTIPVKFFVSDLDQLLKNTKSDMRDKISSPSIRGER